MAPRKHIVLLFLLSISCVFTSCRKCRECTATSWDGYQVAVKSQCATGSASGKSLDKFEDDFRMLYKSYLVTCKDY